MKANFTAFPPFWDPLFLEILYSLTVKMNSLYNFFTLNIIYNNIISQKTKKIYISILFKLLKNGIGNIDKSGGRVVNKLTDKKIHSRVKNSQFGKKSII